MLLRGDSPYMTNALIACRMDGERGDDEDDNADSVHGAEEEMHTYMGGHVEVSLENACITWAQDVVTHAGVVYYTDV